MTSEIEAQIESAYPEYLERGYSTQKADRPPVESAIKRIYKREGIEEVPNFFWVDSPLAARHLMKDAGIDNHDTSLWGAYDIYWLAYYDLARKIAKGKNEDLFDKADDEELDDLLAVASATLLSLIHISEPTRQA